MKKLNIAVVEFSSRLFMGSGKFSSCEAFRQALRTPGSELVTMSLTRVDFDNPADDILAAIDRNKVKIMVNTSGARNAAEAVKIARIAKAGGSNWIKLEIHPDPIYLLPDPIETFIAAKQLVEEGFVVLPYINADPVLAKRLEEIGVAAVMPLGAPIGSNLGIKTREMVRIIIEQSNIPVVVDAGIGLPSQAADAIEMGADAVLVNSAIAGAGNPSLMAEAFAQAVKAAELGRNAQPAVSGNYGDATSPQAGFGDIFA